MIDLIEFTNFKALRKTSLKLLPFNLILGPNGSGKTSVLDALRAAAHAAGQEPIQHNPGQGPYKRNTSPLPEFSRRSLKSVTSKSGNEPVSVAFRFLAGHSFHFALEWLPNGPVERTIQDATDPRQDRDELNLALTKISSIRVYNLDAKAIAAPSPIIPGVEMQPSGAGLAAVLDELQNTEPERWESFVSEMREWFPEYDRPMLKVLPQGQKSILLRTKNGQHKIDAQNLSQGTLVGLALLTLAYLPSPPTVVGLEEIDRGIHPRLLRHLQDALYRLTHPNGFEEKRDPVQVIATTHSPYLLDLYREHPDEVVLASKEGLEVRLKRLSDVEHFEDILGESPLRDVWYSGVLGGAAVQP